MRAETSRQTVAWIARRAADDELSIAPPFQRSLVWQDREKAYLIDTVLKGLPIPEIYVHVQTTPQGATKYSVVDGQQRVRALLGFVKGEFSLDADSTPELPDFKFDQLSEEIKTKVWGYSLVVREIHDASDADVRDLFRRFNRFVFALNSQELRNARFKGEFLTMVSGLADDEFWATNRIVSPADIRRMNDVQFVSELVVGLMYGPQNKTETLDRYYETFEESFPEKDSWSREFHAVQQLVTDLVPNLPNSHWRKKSSFYSLFLVLGELVHGRRTGDISSSEARARLSEYGEKVDLGLSKTPPARQPAAVRAYVNAVGKAASDRDRRLERAELLRQLLQIPSA